MRNIHFGSVYHMPWLEYRYALPDGSVCLRLQTGRDEFTKVEARVTSNYDMPEFFLKAHVYPMQPVAQDEWHTWYQVTFMPHDRRLKYLFVLQSDEQVFKLDASGLHCGADYPEDVSEAFAFAYAYPTEPTPQWARGCVGYEIFPDRFRRGEGSQTDETLEPWTSDRVQNEYRFGGDLRGIIEAVPYLHDLGVEMVYTTPLFLSDTSHRYNTFDYYQVDPLLGTEEDLRELADVLHMNGMRLMLDGVFNHCGLQFAPFRDAVENGENSRYRDWFFFDDTEECGYQTFGHWPYMPKLNLADPDCAAYFLDVGRYWLRSCHIDGWRMDVSPEIWPDFWRKFRNMLREENPDGLMVAECWDDSRQWLSTGDMFHSTMSYVWSRNVWNRFCYRKISLREFDAVNNRSLMLYPEPVTQVLWNFLDTHDTARVRTRAGGSVEMQRAAAFFQFTFPGSPILYYGDELAMEGADDPFCRFPMPWERVKYSDMHRYYRCLAEIRREHPVLRYGSFRTWQVQEDGLYAYLRVAGGETVLCVLNTSDKPVHGLLPLPESMAEQSALNELMHSSSVAVHAGCLQVALRPGEGLIFC